MRQTSAGIPAALFAFFTAVYAFTSAGRLDAADGVAMAQTARSLLRGTLAVPGYTPQITLGSGGLYYTRYGIGQSIVELPFVEIGLALYHVTQRLALIDWAIAFTNTFVTAVGCVLFYLLLRELGASSRRGVALTLLYGLCTLAWPYAKSAFSEPLQATCLIGATLAVVRWRGRRGTRWLVVAGTFLAGLILTKSAALVVVPAFVLYVIASELLLGRRLSLNLLRSRAWWMRGLALQIALLSLPVVACALTLWLNKARFGSPFDFGYGREANDLPFTGSLLTGIFGLLFSFNSGIIFYATPVVLGVLGIRRFVRQHTPEALLIGLVTVILLVLYGSYYYWAGLSAFGPRYLVPLIPLLLLPLVDANFSGRGSPARRRGIAAFVILAAAAGFLEQMLGIIVTFEAYSLFTCLHTPCTPSLDATQSELLYDIWLLKTSVVYNLLGHPPHIALASYPFGKAPISRTPDWASALIYNLRYFWWDFLPHPKVPLAIGALVDGAFIVLCVRRLLRLIAPAPLARQGTATAAYASAGGGRGPDELSGASASQSASPIATPSRNARHRRRSRVEGP